MSNVVIEGLAKKFGEAVVLQNLNLTIEDGEFVVLLGPSGCGKTTVLRCVAGLEAPTTGRIAMGGDIVEDTHRGISVPTQKRDVGLVFQSYALWPHMTVFENVAYPLRIRRRRREEIRERVSDVLRLVGLENYAERGSMELSGGQQQRVALARALIASPRVLLLDEPLSNLDAQRRNVLRKQLRSIHRKVSTTTLYVTHDQAEALTMAGRVLVMRNGVVEQSGTPRDVFERPASRFVAEFLGYENIVPAKVESANGGRIIVNSEAMRGELEIASDLRLDAGEKVDLAFRASNIVIQPLPPDRSDCSLRNSVVARVTDVVYLGDSVECTLNTHDQSFTARPPISFATGTISVGQELSLRLEPEQIVVLPRRGAVT